MNLHISALKMEATYISETWATSSTTTELKSIHDHRESLKPKEDEIGWACSMGDKSNAYMALVGKTKGKRPLRRPRHRRQKNIETDLRGGVVWTGFI
jgi:hypothetical protein